MSEGWTDPGSLDGDALTQWYLRAPTDIEQERQAAAARRYQDFFYGSTGDDAGIGRSVPAPRQDIDPGFSVPPPSKEIDPGFAVPAPSGDIDPGFSWYQVGPNRWRSATTDAQSTSPSLLATRFGNDAAPTDGTLRSNASCQAPANAPSLDNGIRRAAGTQPEQASQVDPSTTPVFQTGSHLGAARRAGKLRTDVRSVQFVELARDAPEDFKGFIAATRVQLKVLSPLCCAAASPANWREAVP